MLSDFNADANLEDPYYGTLSMTQTEIEILTNETDGTTYRNFNFLNIPLSHCKLGYNFNYGNADEAEQYGIEMYYCPDWNNLTLQGNWNSPLHKRLDLNF